MTHAARPLIGRARHERVDEVDLMAAARGRAHLEFGLSAAGRPAVESLWKVAALAAFDPPPPAERSQSSTRGLHITLISSPSPWD